MHKSIAILLASWIVSLLGYVGGVFVLSLVVKKLPSLAPFVFVDTHGGNTFSLANAALLPAAFFAILIFCFILEAVMLGRDRSSLKRLAGHGSESAKVDAFYVTFRLAGGINLLAFVFSFGTLFWLVNQVHRFLHIGFLEHVHSYIFQFIVVYLVNTFVAYWGHRLMHTKWLWELHKVHHAAEEMNVVTPFRNHPIDHVIMSLLNSVPVALMGAEPKVVLVYYVVNLVYQSLVHSEIGLNGKWWDKIWITPAAHRIHHSARQEHWDTNFGIVTFWDYLFGTYRPPAGETNLTYGVEGGEKFNQPRHLIEVFDNVKRWLRPDRKSEAPPQPPLLPPVPDAGTPTFE